MQPAGFITPQAGSEMLGMLDWAAAAPGYALEHALFIQSGAFSKLMQGSNLTSSINPEIFADIPALLLPASLAGVKHAEQLALGRISRSQGLPSNKLAREK